MGRPISVWGDGTESSVNVVRGAASDGTSSRGPPAVHCPACVEPTPRTACPRHAREESSGEKIHAVSPPWIAAIAPANVAAVPPNGARTTAWPSVSQTTALCERLSYLDRGVGRFAKVASADRDASQVRRQHRSGVSQLSGERGVRRQRREGTLLAQRERGDDPQHDTRDGDRRHQLDERQSTAPYRDSPAGGQHGKRVRRTTTCARDAPNTTLSLTSRVPPSMRDDQNSAEAGRNMEPEPAAHGDARICSSLAVAPVTAAERARISFRVRTTIACVRTIPRIATSTRRIAATSSSRRENPARDAIGAGAWIGGCGAHGAHRTLPRGGVDHHRCSATCT